jgi:acyl dehydratase
MASNAEKALEIFQKHMGEEEGVGEWHTVDQKQINQFADATLDHQFIHVDPEKSAKLSPYKVTIAHGFLTLSLVVPLGGSIPPVDPTAYQGVVMGSRRRTRSSSSRRSRWRSRARPSPAASPKP